MAEWKQFTQHESSGGGPVYIDLELVFAVSKTLNSIVVSDGCVISVGNTPYPLHILETYTEVQMILNTVEKAT